MQIYGSDELLGDVLDGDVEEFDEEDGSVEEFDEEDGIDGELDESLLELDEQHPGGAANIHASGVLGGVVGQLFGSEHNVSLYKR